MALAEGLAERLAGEVMERADILPYQRDLFFLRRLMALPGAIELGPMRFAPAMARYGTGCGRTWTDATEPLIVITDLWDRVREPGGLDALERAVLDAAARPVTLRAPLAADFGHRERPDRSIVNTQIGSS